MRITHRFLVILFIIMCTATNVFAETYSITITQEQQQALSSIAEEQNMLPDDYLAYFITGYLDSILEQSINTAINRLPAETKQKIVEKYCQETLFKKPHHFSENPADKQKEGAV